MLTPAVLLFSSLWVRSIPTDLASLAAALALLMTVAMTRQQATARMLRRLAVYITAISGAYLMVHQPGPFADYIGAIVRVAVVLLAGAIAVHVRFAGERKFGTTPTDSLILLAVLALTIFGSTDVSSHAFVELVFGATVLVYGCEVIFDRIVKPQVLQVSALTSLLIIAVRGLL
jgi:hypothetical protein